MMRSGLLAQALASRGHDVTWWASAFDHYVRDWIDAGKPVRQLADRLTLRLLRGIGYRRNVSVQRFVDHAMVARRFSKEAEIAQKPDIIVAALPDYRIAYAAFRFAKRNNIPFILDLRDRWPWDFLDLVPAFLRPLLRTLLAFDFRMAQALIARADVLVTMMESWEGWIEKVGGRSKRANDSVFYLGAEEPRLNMNEIRAPTRSALERCAGRWPILFVGAFTNRSWPKIALDVAQKMKTQAFVNGLRPMFILAGDGDFMPELQRRAEGDLDIVLPGYVNDAEIAALLNCAKAGLVTGNSDFEAMPNKVFTYLSEGVPILSSLGGELQSFLDREGVGLTCADAGELSAAISDLYHDESRRAEISAKARQIFLDRYEAKRLYGNYADLVERIATDVREGASPAAEPDGALSQKPRSLL